MARRLAQGRGDRVLRRRRHPPADDRRAARPGPSRSASSSSSATSTSSTDDGCFGALLSLPGVDGRGRATGARRSTRSTPPAASRSSPPTCWRCVLLDAARRARRRHRRRLGAALRRADGLRRPARRVPRHPRRATPASLPGRLVGRQHRHRRPPGAAPRPADPRAAHPPREGDVATSAPRRCCWPTSPACTPCGTAPTGLRRIAERVHRLTSIAGRRAARPAASSVRQRHVVRHAAPCGSPGRAADVVAAAARRAASTCGAVDADTVGISLDETTTPAIVAAVVAGVRGRRDRSTTLDAVAPTAIPAALRRDRRVPHPPGVPPLPQRARDAALPAPPRRPATSRSTAR